MPSPIPLAVLDLAPVFEGSDATTALHNARDLAQRAEAFGYSRYWMAEHHNMPGIASAATAVALAHVGGGTQRIRIGAGGVMLPNHAPLTIAEQFGTLAALFPGRVDLGVGRAPGTDQVTMRALRRTLQGDVDGFPEDVVELLAWFEPPVEGQAIQAVPGAGLRVPVWILGSSLFGAKLAAMLGLPYAFASHFAPSQMMDALALYRSRFTPSRHLSKPHAMIGVNVIAADTDAEAARLFTSLQQAFVRLRRGKPGKLPQPVASVDDIALSPPERALLDEMLSVSVIGSKETVRRGVEALIERTGADELIVVSSIADHAARVHSYELLADAMGLPAA
jgi:luciferase family oxidoreductase group 1